MSTLSPFLSIDCPCDQALTLTRQKLSQAGLRAVQTFNLTTARLGLHYCTCPNHGTEACDCQLIVLLVYGKTPEPATLILHGNDGRTWLSIAETPLQQGDTALINSIHQVLQSGITEHL